MPFKLFGVDRAEVENGSTAAMQSITLASFSSMNHGFFAGFAGSPKRDTQPLHVPSPSDNRSRAETVWTTGGEIQKPFDESRRKASGNQYPKRGSPKNNHPSLHLAVHRNSVHARGH